jgi:hypothetical protein
LSTSALDRSRARLLAIDAGISSGWSYWTTPDDICSPFSGTLVYEDDDSAFLAALFELQVLITGEKPDYVVMEITKPYHGHLGRRLGRVQALWQAAYPFLNHVQPWQWKPSHAKAKLPKKCKTTHERDAIRLGMWALEDLGRFVPLHP